jgi:hypothetical protein
LLGYVDANVRTALHPLAQKCFPLDRLADENNKEKLNEASKTSKNMYIFDDRQKLDDILLELTKNNK